MYLYELPTTGAVTFSDFCIDLGDKKPYIFFFSTATQARANLRGILKDSKRTDHNEKDYLSLVKVTSFLCLGIYFSLLHFLKTVEEYLPHICAILNCVAHDEIGIRLEPSV